MALFATPKKDTKKPTPRKVTRNHQPAKHSVVHAVHAVKEGSYRIPSAANSAFIKEWASKMNSKNNAFVME